MKKIRSSQFVRLFLGLLILAVITAVINFDRLRVSASNDSSVSIALKSQNTPAINLREGRDLPTAYASADDSAAGLRGGQNRPLGLASADFDVDGFPDLVTGYAAPNSRGGIVTFHRGNMEAFAPQSEESIAGIGEGRFPDPFLKDAQSFAVPAAPDFLAVGDFDRDGNTDVVTAARGEDKIYLLSGTGRDGGFNAAREIDLAGRVTALTAGEIDISDNRADLVVGVENGAGASLLIFENTENGVLASSVNYQLSSPAISLELGRLDDDSLADAAILTADGVAVLHGRDSRTTGSKLTKRGAARLEKINLPFVPQALAIGNFIWNRAGKTQLALLAEDGTIQIARRGELDERPFSIEETRANRRQAAEGSLRGEAEENLAAWQPKTSEGWTIADGTVNVAATAVQRSTAAPILMRANLSGQNTDDILFLDAATREIKILSTQEPEKVNGEAISFAGERSVYTLEAAATPAAMLSMQLNNFVRPGLVILQDGKTEPSVVPSAPTATFVVDRTDDTNAAAAQGCAAAANDCSLRGAITKANGAAGADIITLPAGTYTLTLTNSGANEDSNATGDLDINDSLTINGAGQATTIVQAGTTNANGIDKVFASNPFCTTAVSTTLTAMTVRFGRNTQTFNAADFSFTGGGLDWCAATGNANLTITDSTFDNNSATTGYGGGIDLDTAPGTSGTTNTVALTNVTFSNNKSSPPPLSADFQPNGGGLAAIGSPYTLNITNSTFTGNAALTGDGGGIYIALAANATNNGVFSFNNVTVSNNSAANTGGGIRFAGDGADTFTIQNSTVSGNTSGTLNSKLARGGGIYVSSNRTGSSTITKSTITNNVLSANAATNEGGAGISTRDGAATVSFNRIVGNTGTATLGTGLNQKDSGTGAITRGTTNAAENWWGCSIGPSAAPCDTAVLSSGLAGSLTTTPYIVLRLTASPSTIVFGQNSTPTASFLTDSTGTAIALANITALIGVPITFNNPVKGTISAAQAVIQANGTATATFTGNAPGAGSADAIVDNDVAAAGRTNRATLTINKANSTTGVISSLNPSVVGQSVNFTATITPTSPASGVPTGTVQFQIDGVNFGALVTLSGGTATSGNTTTLTVGNHTVTAIYNGDTNFNTSNSALSGGQTVLAAPDLTITKTHVGNFTQGQTGKQYTITVTNSGGSLTSAMVSVTDALPAGLTATAISGTGWTCTLGTLTCTRSDGLAAGSSYPAITLTVNVAINAPGSITNTANVSGGGEATTSNNAANDPTIVLGSTAASVTVGGQVTTRGGRGLRSARVTITDQFGNRKTVVTTALGYFRLTEIQSGETYFISAAAKGYDFPVQLLNVTGEVTDLRISAQ